MMTKLSKPRTKMQTIELFWGDEARLSSLNCYLQWIGVVLVVIGALVTASSIIIGRQIDHLNSIDRESSQRKILGLEITLRPTPFRHRLVKQLNDISPKILLQLQEGKTTFKTNLKPHHFTDLQRLASEPEAREYITFRDAGELNIRSDIGQTYGVVFTLNPTTFKPGTFHSEIEDYKT